MLDRTISTVFNITPRYLRSTNLERDFKDPGALENYVFTPHARQCLSRLARGLRPGATDRAWRVTGNYGSGKSSFALLLAHWFSGKIKPLTRVMGDPISYEAFGIATNPRYIPVLVTGSREPIGQALLRSLLRVIREEYTDIPLPSLVAEMTRAIKDAKPLSDSQVVEWVLECNSRLITDRRARGMLILLDELGKFLEFAAFHPQQQDAFLLQKLGEAAAASGEKPLFLIGLLHQGFSAYADNLDQATQHEWEKIAGRFEEIVFNQPLAQISQLIASALRVRPQLLTPENQEEQRAGMDAALRLGWMGSGAGRSDLLRLAPQLFPLHATVLPALVRTFSRFGQNERSLFTFLLSNEPFALQDFSAKPATPGNTYRLPEFYDYIRANLGHRLCAQSYRSHWTEIEAMVESFATSDPTQLKVVKTVGTLNLLDDADLAPTDGAIEAALGGLGGLQPLTIRAAVEDLHKKRRVLFRRGVSGSYCLWSHTSVDLEAALEKAGKALGHVSRVGHYLKDILETRPLVARRHYIQTGNLRYFDVRYSRPDELEKTMLQPTEADGVVVVALCETHEDRISAENVARSPAAQSLRSTLIAIPIDPLLNHARLVADALRWDWVALNTPELNGDRFAREEVCRQKQAGRSRLERRIQDLIGLRSFGGSMALSWFHVGAPLAISSARELHSRISNICDNLYNEAPQISNELVNRRNLSSAAAAARMRLIERIFTDADKDLLGMDPAKKPPEMAMYLSILRRAHIHRKSRGAWTLDEPDRSDPCQVRPLFRSIRAFLEAHGDNRVKVSDLLTHLANPPLGIRAGLAPLFLAIYAAIHSNEVAFYEDNTFLPEVRGNEFLRLSKAPETFEIQLCRIAGLRADVFASLVRALEISQPTDRTARVLEVVRPLCQFVGRLPDYSRKTHKLPGPALAVRAAILAATDPVKLLFHDLPLACKMEPFSINAASPSSLPAKQFATRLRSALDDLRGALSALSERMLEQIKLELAVDGRFAAIRERLAVRADRLLVMATEPRLKALCLRFKDLALIEEAWLESLGSLVASQPPSRWSDEQEDTFRRELSDLASRFRNLESIAFKKQGANDWAEAFRLALTREDGAEAQDVIYIETQEKDKVEEIEKLVRQALGTNHRLAMAALSKVLWQSLGKQQT